MKIEGGAQGVDHIWQITNDLLGSNTYICAQDGQGTCILVDPGSNTDEVEDLLAKIKCRPTGIFCTHGHFDHIAGASFFQDRYDIPVHIPGDDLEVAGKSNFLLMAFGLKERIKVPDINVKVTPSDSFPSAGFDVSYSPCPGHTAGSSVIQVGGALFTGDTLYASSVGISKLPGADEGALKASIKSIFETFDGGCLVLPGHGETALLSDIEKHNEPLRVFLETEKASEDV